MTLPKTPPQTPLVSALAAMRGRRVLLVGDPVLDIYLWGETVRVSREAPVVVVRQERREQRLGAAANTAANLAALGVETVMVGSVGQDSAGRELGRMLGALGVDTGAWVPHHCATPSKTRVLAGAPGTMRQQMIRIDDEPTEPLGDEIDRAVAEAVRERAKHTDAIAVSDYGLGTVGPATLAVIRTLAASGLCVCVDSRERLSEFTGVTAVKPNLPEAEALLGTRLHKPEAVAQAGELIRARLECEACLLTQGRGGMTLTVRERPPVHLAKVGADEVTDVTGAGDTVLAVFTAGLAAGLGFHNAMCLANCAAGVVVTKVGTAVATPDEIALACALGGVELLPWAK
jgi:rfaE bifunctional protein kinase chain/domain